MRKISDLRRLCQLTYKDWDKQPIIYKCIRKISIYFTYILMLTPITANGVTVLSIICGLGATIFMAFNQYYISVLLIIISVIFDFCDGEVSRGKNQSSLEGLYLDLIYHFTVQPCIFVGLAISVYNTTHSNIFIILGFISTISVSLLSMTRNYAKYVVFYYSSLNFKENDNSDFENSHDPIEDSKEVEHAKSNQNNFSLKWYLERFLSNLFTFWDFPYFLLLIAFSLILQGLMPVCRTNLFSPNAIVLIFFSITYPLIIFVFIYDNLSKKRVTKENDKYIKTISENIK